MSILQLTSTTRSLALLTLLSVCVSSNFITELFGSKATTKPEATSNTTTTATITTSTITTTTTRYDNDTNNIPTCVEGECQYLLNKTITFSCPRSGCMSISHGIMPTVQVIKLQDNHITAIPELPFEELLELDLANNNISRIDNNAFTKLSNLTSLYLSNNKLTMIKRIHFSNLMELKFLYLDHNNISVLDSDVFFPALVSIVHIDLSSNEIDQIDENAFTQLSQLKFLHLSRNRIKSITRSHLLQLPKLNELILSQNRITQIEPETFGDLEMLYVLDLGYNRIERLQNNSFGVDMPSVFPSRLHRIVLNKNSISSIDVGAFEGLESLQILHLPYNPLKELPPFYLPNSLIEITLHHLPNLKVIPRGVFHNLTNLRRVEIYGNPQLSAVSAGSFTSDLKGLRLLDLSRNNLRTLSEAIVSDWRTVALIDLSGNPWHCDCKLRWMKEVYMDSGERHIIRCSSPVRLSGRYIAGIDVDEFLCGIELMGVINLHRRTGALLIAALSVGFIGFIALFVYRCRRRVFPCHYGQPGAYRALYSPKADEDVEDITITSNDVPCPVAAITVTQSEKKILQAEMNGAPPAPVAL